MRKGTSIIYFSFFLLVLFCGCSKNLHNPVISPDNQDDSSLLMMGNNIDLGRIALGCWDLVFDTKSLEVKIMPDRIAEAHYNVTWMIPTPSIKVNSYNPTTNVIDVDVTIHNPYGISVYDVRGIVFTDNVGRLLLNADDWTNLYDIPGGELINPFRAFAKNAPNRRFAPYSYHTEKFIIYLPPDPSPVKYVIDASYPSNCKEPYMINNFTQTQMLSETGASCDITIDVYDWQQNVNDVKISAPQLTGQFLTQLYPIGGNTWGTTIYNQTGLQAGSYDFIIAALSSDSQSLALYDIVTFVVTSSQPQADWAFLVYLHESNLYEYAIQDINEMEVVGSRTGDLEIIVLWDKEDTSDDVILRIEKDIWGFNDTIISPEIDDNGVVIPPEGLEMGEQETLERFLRWAVANYPAKHYFLDLWDHGDGPFGIVPQEWGFIRSCCNGLSIWEIRDACATVLAENPKIGKFDVIGFDACLMAWIETAYCLRNVCKATLGSEMTEPGDGWFYTTPLQYLIDNIQTCDYRELCRQIVISYLDSQSMWDDCTLSASDNAILVNGVIPALNQFADQLRISLGQHYNTIYECWEDCGEWGAFCWEYDVKDLGYFCKLVAAKSTLPSSLRTLATNLKNKIAEAMIINGHTGEGDEQCPWEETGWQIWFTDEWFDWWNEERVEDYQRLEFTQTTWDEFLMAFHQ